MTAAPRNGRPVRRSDDAGGVWIVTGIVLGAIVYAGMVTMLVAGFTPVTPLVVIPPVLVALIGANSLLGGGRHGRSDAGGTDPRPVESVPSVSEESGEPR